MKKEFVVNQAKFIYTKNELGYQEVLDNIQNASWITIVTFNISERNTYLLNCLKKAPESADIKIITNIPNRWEKYYESKKVNYREIAKRKISVYMTKLKPEDIAGKMSVFFNFDNHGKIIMTNNIVYIGSSNYSEESKNNIEFGFLSEDKQFIRYLTDEVIGDVEKGALPYYAYNYTSLLLESNMAMSALFVLQNEIYDQVYQWYDDLDEQGYYYNTNYDVLSNETLESIQSLIQDTNKIASELYDALGAITDDNEDVLNEMNEHYEKLLDFSKTYEKLMNSDTVYDLACFNYNDYVNELLETDYAMEAYEENLENCIGEASGEANDKLNGLCVDAKGNLDKIIDTINKYMDKMKKYIQIFQKYDAVKVNPSIDNT